MDEVTAGVSLIAVQLCIALFMIGAFHAAPEEACTRYWVKSGVFVGLGVLIAILNHGAPNYVLLILCSNSVIAGAIFQWVGLRAFYGKKAGAWSWIILIAFFVLYLLLLIRQAPLQDRAALASTTIGVIFSLMLYELLRQKTATFSFARALALFGATLVIVNMAVKAIVCLVGYPSIAATKPFAIGVVVMYPVPLIGSLLFSVALLMLYFERLVEIKHHLATHDELTHLLNRRAIIAGGEREIEVAIRANTSLTVAYIDIDFFKKINDELGHANGDTVLTELAAVLRHTCRNTDLIGRYGGEEFCVVLPEVDHNAASVFGERLLKAVRERRFCGKQHVTISIGFAVFTAGTPRRTWASLINEADNALYQAKESGRNKYVIAHASSASVPDEALVE
jgi:diguanylate cyclase (GGDEF)-like protein